MAQSLSTDLQKMRAIKRSRLTVAGAVQAAVVLELGAGDVRAELLGAAPEVVDGVLFVGEDIARGDEDVVDADAGAAVRHVEGVVVREVRRCWRSRRG